MTARFETPFQNLWLHRENLKDCETTGVVKPAQRRAPALRASSLSRVTALVCIAALGCALPASPTLAEEPADQDPEALVEAARGRVHNIDTRELQELITNHPGVVLVDVRTPDEVRATGGRIAAPHSINIPRGWLEVRAADAIPTKDTPVVVYCGTNTRSPLAADTLTRLGYTDVSNYAPGIFAWQEAGLAQVTADGAPDSFLFNKPVEVIDGVWSAIGATAPPSYENSGHNNNLSFIVSDDGVLVVNAGDNYLLAAALHEEISNITDQPVKYVVLENGQGHAMLGSSYWQEQGAKVIAHEDAAQEIEENAFEILERMQRRNRDKALGSRVVLPDETFGDKMVIELGKERIELLNLGPAHSPGDIVIWLPQRKLVISGDMAFHERLLPVFEHTDTAAWIESWNNFAALGAEYVIPGHGGPTTMAEVTRYTRDYLVDLRGGIGEVIDDGGNLEEAYAVDQSAYAHLDTFDELARQNAGRVFRAMEFE
jgi:glyoxylase-like metal-dependent hydrolase (beta-lactamase superfamily II)/rhodanese-related sulfurtransferase